MVTARQWSTVIGLIGSITATVVATLAVIDAFIWRPAEYHSKERR